MMKAKSVESNSSLDTEDLSLANSANKVRTETDLERRQFEAILTCAGQGIYGIDSNARLVFMNTRARELLGLPLDFDVVGKSAHALNHHSLSETEPCDGTNCHVFQTMRDGMPRRSDNQFFRRQDGALFPIELSASAIIEGGNIIGAVVVFSDITQRKAMEYELAKRERLLSTIVENEPECVKLLDREGRLVQINAAGLKIIEVDSEAEVIGGNLESFIQPGYRKAFADLVNHVFAGGSGALEFEIQGRKGNRRWLETHAVPLRDETGEIVRCLGIARDITEHKQSEMALRENEQRLRGILDASPIAVRIATQKGRSVVYSNRRYAELIETELAQGKDPINYYAYRDDYERVLAALAKGETVLNRQIEFRMPSGKLAWVLASYMLMSYQGDEAVLGWFYDITDRKRAEEQIAQLAYHDQLTGLPNRMLFLDRLQQALASARRATRFGAVMFVDLDQFKHINDLHGHSVGDAVLGAVAQRISGALRQGDTLARFGGDEFVVILPELATGRESAATHALAVGEKIRAVLENSLYVHGQEFVVTASIGVSIFPKQDQREDDLIKEADIAMYRAKDLGRNTMICFEDEMQAMIVARYALVKDLRDAIRLKQLELYIQSQVNTTGQVVGGEALLRWNHPVRGMIPPASFISIAEETGQIIPIGEWVLRETCRLIAQLSATGYSLHLAVNVSPRQFHQLSFVDQVRNILIETGADPSNLTLEITEGLLLDRTPEVIARMLELTNLGIRFSIDDFGTGYSSLSYLKRLPLNQLKIDKSFVQDLPNDINDIALVKTILSMARHLGLMVIAEGVETAEQLKFLTEHQCDYYQGRLFHWPQPADKWCERLDECA